MRWNSPKSRTKVKKTTQSHRTTVKPNLETLEDRLAPAINPQTLFLGLGSQIQAYGNALASSLQNSNTALPVINSPLNSLENDFRSAVSSIRNQVNGLASNQAVNNALNSGDKVAAAQAIHNALAPLASNVQVIELIPGPGTVRINMDLSKALLSRTVSLGTGLPALPVQLGLGNVQLQSVARYDQLTFGLN